MIDTLKKRFMFAGCALLLFALCSVLPASFCCAELIDRVVAFVDDKAITLSELNETFMKTRRVQPDISRQEVLITMINRLLLMNEARRLKLEAKSDDELLNEYKELKVRAFIRLKEEELEDFYRKNSAEFQGAPYEGVRDKIEEYLTEREINRKLKEHLAELRGKAQVKIQLNEPSP
jgi:hypothetical protein